MAREVRFGFKTSERHPELGSGLKMGSLVLESEGLGTSWARSNRARSPALGLDFFCFMLDEAVHELRGEPVVHEVDPELSFDVTALCPDD